MRNKNAYKIALETLLALKEKEPHLTRKDRYQILERFLGLSAEAIDEVVRWDRAVREVFPKDEVGEQLEAEWRTPQHQHTANQEWNALFKRNGLDA